MDRNDSHCSLIGIKSEPVESSTFAKTEPFDAYSNVKIADKKTKCDVAIKEEGCEDAYVRITTICDTFSAVRNVSNAGIASNDIKIKLEVGWLEGLSEEGNANDIDLTMDTDSDYCSIGEVKSELIEPTTLLPKPESFDTYSEVDVEKAKCTIIVKQEKYERMKCTVIVKDEEHDTVDVAHNASGIVPNDIKMKLDPGDDDEDNASESVVETSIDLTKQKTFCEKNHFKRNRASNCTLGNGKYSCKTSPGCYKKRNIVRKNDAHKGNYKCDLCAKLFASKGSLCNHSKTHTRRRNYKCDVCDKCFTTKKYIFEHVKTHRGEKDYECDVCNKRFSTRKYKTQHVKTHSSKRSYKCDVCCKCYARKYNLSMHVKTHNGEKKFECEVCAKCFSRKNHLTRHVKSHGGEQKHECDICGKSFVIKKYFLKHVKMHSAEKDFDAKFVTNVSELKNT